MTEQKKMASAGVLFYEVYVLSIIISINLFFLLFVNNRYDYSPNLALLVVSIPIIIIQISRIYKLRQGRR